MLVFLVRFENSALVNRPGCQFPSLPHALSGNPGEWWTGLLMKTFGGDALDRRSDFICYRRA